MNLVAPSAGFATCSAVCTRAWRGADLRRGDDRLPASARAACRTVRHHARSATLGKVIGGACRLALSAAAATSWKESRRWVACIEPARCQTAGGGGGGPRQPRPDRPAGFLRGAGRPYRASSPPASMRPPRARRRLRRRLGRRHVRPVLRDSRAAPAYADVMASDRERFNRFFPRCWMPASLRTVGLRGQLRVGGAIPGRHRFDRRRGGRLVRRQPGLSQGTLGQFISPSTGRARVALFFCLGGQMNSPHGSRGGYIRKIVASPGR